jgi:hypothetical protein
MDWRHEPYSRGSTFSIGSGNLASHLLGGMPMTSPPTGGSVRLRLGTFLIELADSRLRAALAVVVVGACGGIIEYAIHQSLRYSHFGQSFGAVADALIVALATAGMAAVWMFVARERRKRVLREVRVIAELNHNVRNALEVIAHSHYGSNDLHTEMVMESVDRIEKALAELFPSTEPAEDRRSRVLIPERRRHPR